MIGKLSLSILKKELESLEIREREALDKVTEYNLAHEEAIAVSRDLKNLLEQNLSKDEASNGLEELKVRAKNNASVYKQDPLDLLSRHHELSLAAKELSRDIARVEAWMTGN